MGAPDEMVEAVARAMEVIADLRSGDFADGPMRSKRTRDLDADAIQALVDRVTFGG